MSRRSRPPSAAKSPAEETLSKSREARAPVAAPASDWPSLELSELLERPPETDDRERKRGNKRDQRARETAGLARFVLILPEVEVVDELVAQGFLDETLADDHEHVRSALERMNTVLLHAMRQR